MNKEIIPFEEALELKKLGYRGKTNTYYFKSDEVKAIRFATEVGDTIDWNEPSLDEGQMLYDNYVAAPLYQQAFRWFREKHNLIGWIEKYPLQNIYVLELPKCTFDESPFHKTYEDAELACLKKLIEIVKNK
jgi:hypothetical protein